MKTWLVNNPFAVLLLPLLAYILSCTYAHWPRQIHQVQSLPNDTAFYTIVVQSMPQPRATTYRYEVSLLTRHPQPKVLLYLRCDSTQPMPSLGDTLCVLTAWQMPDSTSNFDYATYLKRQGISATGYVANWAWQTLGKNQTPWWRRYSEWQQLLKERYEKLGIKERELGTICALTLGYREDLEPNLKRQFSAAGAMHVLAVSGLHTGILMQVLIAVITLFGLCKPLYEERVKKIIVYSVVILALVAYAWLTGGSPSVVRAVVMAAMVLLAKMCCRRNQMINALLASAFFILVVRPMDLFSVSFQLSYAAVLSIALFAPGWKRVVPKNYLTGILGMSLAATIGTLPVTLYYFGQISNYFLLTNCIVIPLAWMMMVGGVLVLTLGWITPLGYVFAWLLNGVTWLMNESVEWLEGLPYSTTMVQLPWWGMWILVAVNLGIVIAWDKITTEKINWKQDGQKKKREKKELEMGAVCGGGSAVCECGDGGSDAERTCARNDDDAA